ncbi:Periplasmic pH-dependent serine endoprotease DegQ [Serratia symbiotica]|nr:Periplasmic pH-dependent serine endoprotease DegQ [Serratia symbiotica]
MKKKFLIFSVLLINISFTFFSLPVSSTAIPFILQGESLPSLALMLEKVLPTVVSIHVEGTQTQYSPQLPKEFKYFFGQNFPDLQLNSRPFQGLGSGVIINAKKGYILTNNHVINNADKIHIQLNDGREFEAKLIGHDEQSDIALLKINEVKNLTEIKIADSDQLRVGDFAVAIGNPFGLGQTATSGIISALGRSGLNLEGLENFIQTDASINRGNSGGALVNLNGELIGINTAILAPNGGNIGIGFAIPGNMAKNLSQQLIEFGQVKRGTLGIKGSEMTPDIAKAFNSNIQRGAFVSEVLSQSAASKAGIKSGDILISVDGKSINSFSELRAKIATTTPGKKIIIGLLRDGDSKEVTVILDNNDNSSIKAEILSPVLLGVSLSNSSLQNNNETGVKVDNVDQGSIAERSGLKKNDIIIGVNRQHIKNIITLRKILEKKPSIIALNIIRGNENIYLLLH